jgi:hypothetical protein
MNGEAARYANRPEKEKPPMMATPTKMRSVRTLR